MITPYHRKIESTKVSRIKTVEVKRGRDIGKMMSQKEENANIKMIKGLSKDIDQTIENWKLNGASQLQLNSFRKLISKKSMTISLYLH